MFVPVSTIFHDKFLILLISFWLIVWFDVAMNLNVAIAILLMVMIPPYVSFFLQQHLLWHLPIIQSKHVYQLLIPLWIWNYAEVQILVQFFPEECLKEFSITCWTWFENEILVNFEKTIKWTKISISNEIQYVILSSFKNFSGLKFGLRIQFVINTNFWNFKLKLHLKLQVKFTTLNTPDHLSSPKFNFELTLDQIRNHLKPLD